MRKTWDSSKTESTWRFSSRASPRRVPNGFSITTRTSALFVAVEPVLAQLADDHREELRRRREVEDAVEDDPGLLVELVELVLEALVDAGVVERARDVAHALEQRVEHLSSGLRREYLLDRLARHPAEVVVRDVRARHPDQVEALGQRALVREVVERRQQLAVGEVARGAEDHQRRRVDRQPLEPLDEGVLLLSTASGYSACGWPGPRSAASRRGRRTGCAARR